MLACEIIRDQGDCQSELFSLTIVVFMIDHRCQRLSNRSLLHIPNFNAAKFSIKLFSFIYLTVSVVRQRNEYEIVYETQAIKTT